jgi:hypothetical protein
MSYCTVAYEYRCIRFATNNSDVMHSTIPIAARWWRAVQLVSRYHNDGVQRIGQMSGCCNDVWPVYVGLIGINDKIG